MDDTNDSPGLRASSSIPSAATMGGMAGGNGPADLTDDLLNRVAQSAHDVIDRLAERAAPHVHRLQEGMGGAGHSLQDSAEHLRELGDEWTEAARRTTRENPLSVLLVALAVGLLVGELTRR
jgi:ElaB/YqjD/DUF883 family membrane-anchored ribosome-binding protein